MSQSILRSILLFSGFQFASARVTYSGDGLSAELFQGLAHDTISAVFQGDSKGRQLKAVVESARAEAQGRRLDSGAEVASGQSGGAAGPSSSGMTEAVVNAQCTVTDVPCISVAASQEVCGGVKMAIGGASELTTPATANKCFCDECPGAAKFVDHVTKVINDGFKLAQQNDPQGGCQTSPSQCAKMMEQTMMVKGMDEIAGMCTHQPAMDCVFGGTKTGCASILTAAETTFGVNGKPECLNSMGAGAPASTGAQIPQCVTVTDAVKNVMLPQYACLCVDCNYADYAAAIAPITKKLITEQDMFPVMQDLTKAMCEKKDTMKCFMGTTGNCGKADAYILQHAPDQQQAKIAAEAADKMRKAFYNSLDCLCTSCPDAMPKMMTIMEKQEKGELQTEAQQAEAVCGLYPEIGCFLQKSACKDAASMLLSAAGQTGAAPTMTDEEFTKQAEEQKKMLKDKCAQNGITVKEFVDDSSEASVAPGLKPSLLPLALLAAAFFVRL